MLSQLLLPSSQVLKLLPVHRDLNNLLVNLRLTLFFDNLDSLINPALNRLDGLIR